MGFGEGGEQRVQGVQEDIESVHMSFMADLHLPHKLNEHPRGIAM